MLLTESIHALNIKSDGIYVDATGGAGGHAAEILPQLTDGGQLVIIDCDPDAIKVLKERFKAHRNVFVVLANFRELESVLNALNFPLIDGVLMDLGVSSYQIDNPERGFCYKVCANLDMRMGKKGNSAKEIVNNYSVRELVNIFKWYGEEKSAVVIAKRIEKCRLIKPIETTFELVEIIEKSIPSVLRRHGGNPAKRVFQAIRIEVNNELESLKCGLNAGFFRLKCGGRLCVVTFHSLEDSLVKSHFRKFVGGCVCSAKFPICSCGKENTAEIITTRPIVPSENEISMNKRAKSAKLRVLKKL